MQTRPWRIRIAVAALVLGGCAGGTARSPFAAPRAADEPIRVEVRNDNYLDVTVYVMPDGSSYRLGDVTGSSSATLEIPRSLVPTARGIRLLVDPIGSQRSYMTETISIVPGDIIVLRVASVLSMSSWSLRRAGSAPPQAASGEHRSNPTPRVRGRDAPVTGG